jgi:pimeloyl-ACP methyl ester carboxylesterase
MAHGLGGTKDSGLEPYAERLAAAGLPVLAFDYRGFGGSSGVPRQCVSMSAQIADYRAAMAAAAQLPGVDPGRLVLWGVSLAGGHVFIAGAERDDVAAIVSVTPLVNGMSAARLALRHHRVGSIARSSSAGLASSVSKRLRKSAVMMPVVGRPGEVAALSLDGYYEDYLSIAGPTWRNEIDASLGGQLGAYRADRSASRITCPVLMQIADFDRGAPPQAAAKAAFKARAEVRHYPCDHFGVYAGQQFFDPVVTHQIAFLLRHLARSAVTLR